MTKFIDKIQQPKNTEFKMIVGAKTKSEPIECEILDSKCGKKYITYKEGTARVYKWVMDEQIVEG